MAMVRGEPVSGVGLIGKSGVDSGGSELRRFFSRIPLTTTASHDVLPTRLIQAGKNIDALGPDECYDAIPKWSRAYITHVGLSSNQGQVRPRNFHKTYGSHSKFVLY